MIYWIRGTNCSVGRMPSRGLILSIWQKSKWPQLKKSWKQFIKAYKIVPVARRALMMSRRGRMPFWRFLSSMAEKTLAKWASSTWQGVREALMLLRRLRKRNRMAQKSTKVFLHWKSASAHWIKLGRKTICHLEAASLRKCWRTRSWATARQQWLQTSRRHWRVASLLWIRSDMPIGSKSLKRILH